MIEFIKFLENLSEQELELFERELKEGYVQKYVERKKEFFKVKDKICPVCNNTVDVDCFVLMFGEPSFRKKAHFCGIDCLKYFLDRQFKDNSFEQNNSISLHHKANVY